MSFLSSIPTWVKHFPYDADRAALTQLAKSSRGKFEKLREMNIVLYDFADTVDLEGATHQLAQAGWKCTTQPQAGAHDRVVLTGTKSNYCLTEQSYTHDVLFFQRIAQMYHAKYDGWFASN